MSQGQVTWSTRAWVPTPPRRTACPRSKLQGAARRARPRGARQQAAGHPAAAGGWDCAGPTRPLPGGSTMQRTRGPTTQPAAADARPPPAAPPQVEEASEVAAFAECERAGLIEHSEALGEQLAAVSHASRALAAHCRGAGPPGLRRRAFGAAARVRLRPFFFLASLLVGSFADECLPRLHPGPRASTGCRGRPRGIPVRGSHPRLGPCRRARRGGDGRGRGGRAGHARG
jgi:hypothetical protein